MTIGARIRKKREEAGIGQTELANLVGISKQTLYKYEQGIITNIPSDVIERLSLRLGVSPAYLMGWSDETPSNDLRGVLVDKVQRLDEEQATRLLKYLEFLLYEKGEKT